MCGRSGLESAQHDYAVVSRRPRKPRIATWACTEPCRGSCCTVAVPCCFVDGSADGKSSAKLAEAKSLEGQSEQQQLTPATPLLRTNLCHTILCSILRNSGPSLSWSQHALVTQYASCGPAEAHAARSRPRAGTSGFTQGGRTSCGPVAEARHPGIHFFLVLPRKLPQRAQHEVHGVNARLAQAPQQDVEERREVVRRQPQHARSVHLADAQHGQRARVGDGGVAQHSTRHGRQHSMAALEDALHCGRCRLGWWRSR